MTLAAEIRKKINQLPEGKIFGYNDICITKENYLTAAKALERMQKEGLIKKVSKGVFYKPQQTVFGELEPVYGELLRSYLFENGKRVAYETGSSLYNKLGLIGLAFQGSNVLEVAAGTGHNSLYVAHQRPSSLTLLEPNPTCLAHIEQAYGDFQS